MSPRKNGHGNGRAHGNGKDHGKRQTHHARTATLPRKLVSASLKKRSKLAVVFQGGSVTERMEKANLLAAHLALKLYRVDLRPCISRFIGETEKNLDRIFGNIPAHETLLYFDEADALFDKHGHVARSSIRGSDEWISYFNKRLQMFPGSVVVATNLHTKGSMISRQLKPVVTHIH